MGTGNFDGSTIPVNVVGEHNHFVSLCAAYVHTCGLLTGTKRIACFGKEHFVLQGMFLVVPGM